VLAEKHDGPAPLQRCFQILRKILSVA
jgi:hypothetical protein